MNQNNAPNTGLAKNKSCWSFGNPYSLRFLDDPPADPPPASLVGADGALAKDWHKQAPEGYEDLREDPSLATVKNLWGLSKNYTSTKKMVGADTMVRPSEKFTDSDWDDYYKAGGRPDTKEDYNIQYSEDIPEEMRPSKDVTEKFQEVFHKHGASKKLVDALSELNDELLLAEITKNTQALEEASGAVEAALRKDWGLAYDQNVHRGNVAIDKDKDVEKDPAYKARLLEKVNKDPDLIRFASNMGYKFVEHHIVEDPGIPSPGDLQEQIADLMADERYSSKDKTVRQPIIDKIMRLREQLRANK